MKLTSLLLMLLLSLVPLTGCSTKKIKIPEFNVYITLPAVEGDQNQDHEGLRLNVLTGETYIIPAAEWKKLEKRTIKIMPEDYAIIKKFGYGYCISLECEQPLDFISHTFETMDAQLGKVQK